MGLTDIVTVQNAMRQAGLKTETTDLLEWLIEAVESQIKGETRRKVLELGVKVELAEALDDSEADVDVVPADYRKVEIKQILKVDSEEMLITAKSGSPILTVTRGYNSTTKATHTSGTEMQIIGMEEVRDGKGLEFIYTREYPVVEVSKVYDSADRSYGSGDLIDSADYVWMSSGKIRRVSGVWYDGIQNMKVVYNAGFSPVPRELERLATEWVILAFKGLDRLGVSTVSSPTEGSVSMFYEFLTPELKRLLNRYRRPLLAI